MKKVFVFGYKVKPTRNNPDYLKVSFGYAGVWVAGSSQWLCEHISKGIVLAECWEIVSEESSACVSPEQLTDNDKLEKYQSALTDGPGFYVVKVAPGETHRTESN